jgi:hypothetical protein
VQNAYLHQAQGMGMPYTMEQFRKDYVRAHISELPPEEVMAKFDPDIRLKGLNPEDRLKGLDPDVIEAYLCKVKKSREQ